MKNKNFNNDSLESLLFLCTDFLNELDIPFWLDCGTLLGAYRDNELLKWEKDIDLSTFKKEIDSNQISKIVVEFRNKGFMVNVFGSSISIFNEDFALDIKLLEPKEDFYYEQKFIPKNLFSSAVELILLNLSTDYGSQKFGKTFLNSLIINFISNIFKFFPRKIKSLIENPLKKIYNRYLSVDVSEAVPKKYFKQFRTFDFLDRSYSIPESTEDYLTFRYGEDWRTPNKSWITAKDDGGYNFFKEKKHKKY
tara:strand:- start:256 stop:1008 length:753 start_codon:yes stop_codon:yes gene_type:complete